MEKSLKALEGQSIAHVNVRPADDVEFAIPGSEGWRLVVSATHDEEGKPKAGSPLGAGSTLSRSPASSRADRSWLDSRAFEARPQLVESVALERPRSSR